MQVLAEVLQQQTRLDNPYAADRKKFVRYTFMLERSKLENCLNWQPASRAAPVKILLTGNTLKRLMYSGEAGIVGHKPEAMSAIFLQEDQSSAS